MSTPVFDGAIPRWIRHWLDTTSSGGSAAQVRGRRQTSPLRRQIMHSDCEKEVSQNDLRGFNIGWLTKMQGAMRILLHSGTETSIRLPIAQVWQVHASTKRRFSC